MKLIAPPESLGRFLAACAVLLGALSAALPSVALAQDVYPSRAITLVVPFPAGSGTDVSARLLAKDLTESLGQSVVVENRPGANGSLGAQIVMRAKPDGHTLLIGAAATNASNYAFYPGRLGYTPASFDIVGGLGIVPLSLVVAANAPWKTLADLIADAKRNPGRMRDLHAARGHQRHQRSLQRHAACDDRLSGRAGAVRLCRWHQRLIARRAKASAGAGYRREQAGTLLA